METCIACRNQPTNQPTMSTILPEKNHRNPTTTGTPASGLRPRPRSRSQYRRRRRHHRSRLPLRPHARAPPPRPYHPPRRPRPRTLRSCSREPLPRAPASPQHPPRPLYPPAPPLHQQPSCCPFPRGVSWLRALWPSLRRAGACVATTGWSRACRLAARRCWGG
ncbi:uncharacterized protein K452DRAFT_172611 [Aplosporella prunicola CBS 121167]|uniref:Uncharacterized protein n=1 Tax=Aplosporella prunicola CBS 121167 TaxID=1176127 RepID=A0A6A6AXE1_9PEZI|nr:uncharacterized protein K452DRAFT_172611 [Aplosporella prunicola CBS 121167]KAF2135604.1 hypothetical protein K452DRAFT_172611 [Aplosporella prunicola CBS 121167]